MLLHHPDPFTSTWRARWIWFETPRIHAETATRPVQTDPVDTVALFRTVVELDAVPASAPARIWIDGRYVLVVNGTEIARGPVRSDPRAAHYDIVDLAPHLRAGPNVIAVTGRHFGTATSWWMPVPPSYSLGAGSMVFEALIGDRWLCSDRSWRCCRAAAWTPVPVPGDVACLPLESFDARVHPFGWDDSAFDDDGLVERGRDHTRPHRCARTPVAAERTLRDAATAGAHARFPAERSTGRRCWRRNVLRDLRSMSTRFNRSSTTRPGLALMTARPLRVTSPCCATTWAGSPPERCNSSCTGPNPAR